MKTLLRSIIIYCLALLLLSISLNSLARPKIRVGILVQEPPLAYINKDGKFDGIAVTLWRKIASELNYDYTLNPVNTNYNQAIIELKKGKYDLLIGAFSVTPERLKQVDFSRPFLLNTYGLAVNETRDSFLNVIKNFFGGTLLLTLCASVLLLLFFSHLYWLSERGSSPFISREYMSGVGNSIWLMLVGIWGEFIYHPDKTRSRIIVIGWCFTALILLTALTAIATSSLIHSITTSHQRFRRQTDLKGAIIAVQVDTVFPSELKRYDAKMILTHNSLDALKMLYEGKVNAVLHDYIILKTEISEHPEWKLVMSPLILDQDELAFPVRYSSPYIQNINIAIKRLNTSHEIENICRKYIGGDAKFCNL